MTHNNLYCFADYFIASSTVWVSDNVSSMVMTPQGNQPLGHRRGHIQAFIQIE